MNEVQPEIWNWIWFQIKPFPTFNGVMPVHQVFIQVERRQHPCICVKNITDFFTDQLINSLHIHLRSQSRLHTVYDCQLCRTLLFSLEEPGILQHCTNGGGKRLQKV